MSPDRDAQLKRLAEADAHITEAERAVAVIGRGCDTPAKRRTVLLAKAHVARRHRRLLGGIPAVSMIPKRGADQRMYALATTLAFGAMEAAALGLND